MISVDEAIQESTNTNSMIVADFLIGQHNKQGRLDEFYIAIFTQFSQSDSAKYKFLDRIVQPLPSSQVVSPKVIQTIGSQLELVPYVFTKINQAHSTNKTHLYYIAKTIIEHLDASQILESDSLNSSLSSLLTLKSLSNTDTVFLAEQVANKLTKYFREKDSSYRMLNKKQRQQTQLEVVQNLVRLIQTALQQLSAGPTSSQVVMMLLDILHSFPPSSTPNTLFLDLAQWIKVRLPPLFSNASIQEVFSNFSLVIQTDSNQALQ